MYAGSVMKCNRQKNQIRLVNVEICWRRVACGTNATVFSVQVVAIRMAGGFDPAQCCLQLLPSLKPKRRIHWVKKNAIWTTKGNKMVLLFAAQCCKCGIKPGKNKNNWWNMTFSCAFQGGSCGGTLLLQSQPGLQWRSLQTQKREITWNYADMSVPGKADGWIDGNIGR